MGKDVYEGLGGKREGGGGTTVSSSVELDFIVEARLKQLCACVLSMSRPDNCNSQNLRKRLVWRE
jgi:hypothetical protein